MSRVSCTFVAAKRLACSCHQGLSKYLSCYICGLTVLLPASASSALLTAA